MYIYITNKQNNNSKNNKNNKTQDIISEYNISVLTVIHEFNKKILHVYVDIHLNTNYFKE
jgi:cytochrome b